MENKTATMRNGEMSNVTMQEGTMREEERGDENGGHQWGYSAGKGCLLLFFYSFLLRRADLSGVHAVLVYLTRSFPVPSQKHGL